MKVNKDFFYIYSPERIAIGQAVSDIENNYDEWLFDKFNKK